MSSLKERMDAARAKSERLILGPHLSERMNELLGFPAREDAYRRAKYAGFCGLAYKDSEISGFFNKAYQLIVKHEESQPEEAARLLVLLDEQIEAFEEGVSAAMAWFDVFGPLFWFAIAELEKPRIEGDDLRGRCVDLFGERTACSPGDRLSVEAPADLGEKHGS